MELHGGRSSRGRLRELPLPRNARVCWSTAYIYIYIERERDRHTYYIYIYTYIYVYDKSRNSGKGGHGTPGERRDRLSGARTLPRRHSLES